MYCEKYTIPKKINYLLFNCSAVLTIPVVGYTWPISIISLTFTPTYVRFTSKQTFETTAESRSTACITATNTTASRVPSYIDFARI